MKCLTKCARPPHKVLHCISLIKSQSMTNLLTNINVLRHFQISYSRKTCSNYSFWSNSSRKVSIVTILSYTFQYGESWIYQPFSVLMVVFLVYRQVPHPVVGFWIHKKCCWSVTFPHLYFFTICFYNYIFVLSRKWMSVENSYVRLHLFSMYLSWIFCYSDYTNLLVRNSVQSSLQEQNDLR